jgi:hypothetical protein
MPEDKAQITIDTVDETVNYRDGFNFDFEDAGHVINVHCSSVSGKESIYLDGELVASKRSYRRKSSIKFAIDENNYEVEFNVVDMLKGETHCTLIKNDVHVKTIKKALLMKYQLTAKSTWIVVFLIFVFGGLSGFILMDYLLSIFGG